MNGDVTIRPVERHRAALNDDARAAMNAKNLLLLIYLRWIAVVGQIATIIVVHFYFGIALPLPEMLCVIGFLVTLNIISLHRRAHSQDRSGTALFMELLLDVAALTAQLYLSGGATNPFVSLYLLQVILGAVLLEAWATWTIVAVTAGSFIWLTQAYRPISGLHSGMHGNHAGGMFDLHIQGMFLCFLLAAVLLVWFINRINANLGERDARLAQLEHQAFEEEHIMRLGLLASGAAHELGTPLATLTVILSDWDKVDTIRKDSALSLDLREVQLQLKRCKEIVSGILLSSGQARGEDARRTTLSKFLDRTISEWDERRKPGQLEYRNNLAVDLPIVSDTVFRQMLGNVLDNAVEASPHWVGIQVDSEDEDVVIAVHDRGNGFPECMLTGLGVPYCSSKDRDGSGLGLFLVVNILRKIGGSTVATNRPEGGATVTLRFPVSALRLEAA